MEQAPDRDPAPDGVAQRPEAASAESTAAGAPISRRALLGAGAAVIGAAGLPLRAAAAPEFREVSRQPYADDNRIGSSFRVRLEAARVAASRKRFAHRANGEETDYPYVANFHKTLPHDEIGEVDPSAYRALLKAARTGRVSDFDRIPLGLGRKLVSAQAGLSFDLQGCDSHHTGFPPAPRIDSAEGAAEMVESYWLALLRDVAFGDYPTSPLAAAACSELSALSDYRGRKDGGRIRPDVLFRGLEAGCEVGPYVSQFLLQDIPFGAALIVQRNQTTPPGADYMTDVGSWLAIQNGADPRNTDVLDTTRRHIRNLRDLGRWVQIDALYQAYLHAALYLLAIGAPVDPGLPPLVSKSCEGFVDFGAPHVLSLVAEVSTRALKAVWFHKWFVHRRARPEAVAGLVHHQLTGRALYPLHPEMLGSEALERVYARHGTYLLPMAFPEGSPAHPSYGSGHATVAGACTTVLKAWFDESYELPLPVQPNAEGTALEPYGDERLTVGGELNKVAANVAIGRNGAGVHWLSDYYESLRLGEYVAKTILEEQKRTYNQTPTMSFTSFDGHRVTI